MDHTIIKEKLISIMQDGDVELLQLMYDVVEDYQHREEKEWSEAELKWLKEQSELRKRGFIKLISWNDAKTQIIRNRKAFGK